jgi:hypothetical protein
MNILLVEGASSSLTSLSEADLRQKVQKLMDLFGIEDLDDIIKVTPIKSMRKIESIEPCKFIFRLSDNYTRVHCNENPIYVLLFWE